jgi:hypothetical protein
MLLGIKAGAKIQRQVISARTFSFLTFVNNIFLFEPWKKYSTTSPET